MEIEIFFKSLPPAYIQVIPISMTLYSLNNTVIPCVFLPFLAENYELYLIYVK